MPATPSRRADPDLPPGDDACYGLNPDAAEAGERAWMADPDPVRAMSLAREPAVRLGALSIDPATRRIAHDDGREEIIEPRVMQVLVALLRAEGRIVPRDELFATCWPGVMVGEDALNRVMGRLRRLASGLGAESFKIETVTKVGYRLTSPHIEPATTAPRPAAEPARGPSICVLPFTNMSDDPQQAYFSDGVSEDITTDLSKVSALFVVARTTAFDYRGKTFDVARLAKDLSVSHVLEGSVRKADGRVRINAQLIDGATGGHVWAERYDRDLADIFAVQSEISEAIVGALRLKLLPKEKEAIERSETSDVDAYNHLLMARQYYDTAREGDTRAQEAIERLCLRATEIDPNYVRAWTLLAAVQSWLHFGTGRPADAGGGAIDRALLLDETSADAHAYKARHLFNARRHDEGFAEIEVALALDPRSWAANSCAAGMYYHLRQFEDAARYYERCVRLLDSAKGDPGQLLSCYMALNDAEGMRRAAEMTVVRTEQALLSNHVNGAAVGCIAAYAVLGRPDRAQELIRRSMLIDPENLRMCFNFACGAINYLHDIPLALEMLEQAFPKMTSDWLEHVAIDPDLDPLRDHPRFKTLVAEASARVARASQPGG